ncbi:MAG TPA: amino acid adenylation domain-containing protein, partial [Blastocatellia bacterium]|nr:amino acid adenylation domain-containing protein [Blastocatellia bacterium]
MFVLQTAEVDELVLPGVKLSGFSSPNEVAKFDLTLMLTETENGLSGSAFYASDIYEASTIDRLLVNLKTLLEAMVEAPEQKVGLALLSEGERRQLLGDWNRSEAPLQQWRVHERIEEQAQWTPDAVAVEYRGQKLTYADLSRMSNIVGSEISGAGAKKGDPVVIFVEDRVMVIAAMIGILKAGCAFVPISSDLPNKRIEAMLEVCSPCWAILDESSIERFKGLCANAEIESEVIPVQRIKERYSTESMVHYKWSESDPDDFCYIYFTSGSTGRPKAIAGRLKAIDHFIRWEIDAFSLSPRTRASQLTSPAFDAFLRDAFAPLCAGGTLCIPPDRDLVLEAGRLARWVDEQRVSLIHTVPSVFRLLLSQREYETRYAGVRQVLLAGEAIEPADVGRWYELTGGSARLVNLYGPTETTMTKFVYEVKEGDRQRRSVPIGKPMPGAKAVIVDDEGRVCPKGKVGEIYIRTPYRTLGYYGRADLTGEVFIENPFGKGGGDIVYKTGDLGRVLDDGDYELVGRRDQQVKVRGVRVELGEVEAGLRRCAGVAEAAVVDRADGEGNKYLCAYVVMKAGAAMAEVKRQVAEELAEYARPSAYVELEGLPLTANGKVDRKALPAPQRQGEGTAYQAPRGADEEIIAGVLAEVLRRERVGANENFFELGGHSLLATQVVARVRQAFGVELPLRALFEAPTAAGLAQHVRQARGVTAGEAGRIQRRASGAELRLSYAQQRLWFIEQLEPGTAAYNMPLALRVEGELSQEGLRQSINEVVRRHEALRTRFTADGGEAVQQVAEQLAVAVAEVDLSRLGEVERRAEAVRLAGEEASEGFELRRLPLLRARRLRLSEGEQVVAVTMHHIVSDGWSMGVLVREFGRLYAAYVKGEPSGLEELEVQYADYAEWQRQWLSGAVLEEQMQYWREQLEGVRALELPTDRRRAAAMSHRGGSVALRLGRELSERLKEASRREGVTVFMALMAGL